MLTQLSYLSQPTRTLAMGELAALLEGSRRRNEERGITGLLVVAPDRYFQIVEGSAAAVDALHRSLLADPRHDNLVPLNRRTIGLRSFPDWSMGIEEVGPCGLDTDLRQTLFRLISRLPDLDLRERVTDTLPGRQAA